MKEVQVTIGVFFDGTSNNSDNIKDSLDEFSVKNRVLQHEISEADFAGFVKERKKVSSSKIQSYLNYHTNIFWLNKLYANGFNEETLDYQFPIYIEGVGTDAGDLDCLLSFAFGTGSRGVVAKTEKSLVLLELALKLIKDNLVMKFSENEFFVTNIRFDLFGFSRGAVSASLLARRVFFKDVFFQNIIHKSLSGYVDDRVNINTRFVGLFDSVSEILTQKYSRKNKLLKFDDSNYYLPPNVADHVFHITAAHECRANFPLNSLKPIWNELALPGTHSDIGGGYFPIVEENVFLTRPLSKILPLGLMVNRNNTHLPFDEKLSALKKNLALEPILNTTEPELEEWSEGGVFPDNKGILMSRNVSTISIRNRIVFNNWSVLSLKVMIDAAEDAGVNFKKIDENFPQLQLPEDLVRYYLKARKISQDVRNNLMPTEFSKEEIDFIASKYIHCSANWNPVRTGKGNSIYDDINPLKYLKYVNRPGVGWERIVYKLHEYN